MDPYSGRIYDLGADLTGPAVEPGQLLELTKLRDQASRLERELTADERLALEEARMLVSVSPEAAQVARVGSRELDRRRKRNRAARASRKRNR